MLLFELFEALTPNQKKSVDKWKRGAKHHTKLLSVFKDGNRITVPFTFEENKEEANNVAIDEFLNDNSYYVTDYIKGKCKKQNDKREFRIGAVLNKLKAPVRLIHSFANDEVRKSSNTNSKSIIYTIDPYDVAAMSTDRGWTSCMNLAGGEYHHNIKYDLKYGTIVAYLVNHDDTDIEDPIARITIKPLVNEETNDVVFFPEGKKYGDAPDGFQKQVEVWCEQNFAPSENTLYVKNPNLYNDEGRSLYMKGLGSDPESIKKQLNGVRLDPSIIQFIENPSEEVQITAIKQDADSVQYIKNPSEKAQMLAVRSGGSLKYIKNPSEKVKLAAINQSSLAIKHIQNPSEKLQLLAINKNASVISYIENPTEKVQMLAIDKNPRVFQHIKHPTLNVQIAAVSQIAAIIVFIKNPSEELQLLAVNRDPLVVGYIENPTDKVQMLAISKSRFGFGHIKNPSEAAIKYAEQLNRF